MLFLLIKLSIVTNEGVNNIIYYYISNYFINYYEVLFYKRYFYNSTNVEKKSTNIIFHLVLSIRKDNLYYE